MSDADAAWAQQEQEARRFFEEQEALRADPAWVEWLAQLELIGDLEHERE
jgi:hypothetical protein